MALAIVRGMAHQGMALKLERVRSRVTQTKLAHELGLSRQWVTKAESQAVVTPEDIRRYRIALLKCADIREDVA
jgi:transcriptional regulator with XRE-family HTH domain